MSSRMPAKKKNGEKKEKEFKPMSSRVGNRQGIKGSKPPAAGTGKSGRQPKQQLAPSAGVAAVEPVESNSAVGGPDKEEDGKNLRTFITTLTQKTDMSEEEVRERHAQFRLDCPGGVLTKQKFLEMSGEALGPDADTVADTLFKIFDEDQDDRMNFVEYMMAVQSTQLDSPEEKLNWIFQMYDKDSSGSIETEELCQMFSTLFDMSGVTLEQQQMDMLVADVMQTLDEDGNGQVDQREFVEGSMKTPFIFNLLCPSSNA